ncbi:unnamed protein product [Ectocarpus fasciculatus]
MSGVVFAVTLALTCVRMILVIDAVSSASRVARVVQVMSSPRSQMTTRGMARGMTSGSPRQQAPAGAGSAKVRTLHKRLLMMHFIAAMNTSAGCFKYMLPASDISCLVTQRAMALTTVLYDASLVLFLLAKTSVTNGNRTLAAWEKCISWWSRFYAWGYLPFVAASIAIALPGVANEEGTFCLAGSRAEGEATTVSDTMGFVTNNVMLIIQFVLLLAMFVKPMMVSHGGTQSGGAIYRRLVARNITCTVAIVLAYAITTVVVVLAVLGASPGSNQGDYTADIAPPINIFMTLCLTEIALPLGFSSCLKAVKAGRNAGVASPRNMTVAATTKRVPNRYLQSSTTKKSGGSAVVPTEVA